MVKILIRIVVNAFAFWVAAQFVGGISLADDIWVLLFIGIVFGLVNAFVRPIVKLLTLPISIVTLGLFSLVINTLMVMLTVWIVDGASFSGGFFQNFVSAFLASIIISIVSTVLGWFLD